MGIKEIFEKTDSIVGILGRWSATIDKSMGVVKKGVDISGKVQENSHKASLNELTIKEKIQAIEDNKNDRAAVRKRIDELYSKIVKEHDDYVESLKNQGMFVEMKKEVNDDWKTVLELIDMLEKRYLK